MVSRWRQGYPTPPTLRWFERGSASCLLHRTADSSRRVLESESRGRPSGRHRRGLYRHLMFQERRLHMRTTLLTGLLFALTAGALAQTPQALLETPLAQDAAVSSNGPVVLDYGKGAFPNDVEGRLAKQVRHQLLLLPYYSLFDDLEYSVQGRTVTLSGFVTGE